MTAERTKILDKAKKLKELAVRGIGGEQTNAKYFLEKYMLKHSVTQEELERFNSSNSSYVNMSDEEFMSEIIKEIIPVLLGAITSKYGMVDDEFKARSKINVVEFADTFLNAILERYNKKTRKTHE